MIIDASYFQNKAVYIPNSIIQPSLGDNTPNAQEELNQEINEKEASLLLDALGYEQLAELDAQFNDDGSWIDEPDQKWVDLVEGRGDWRGLRYKIGPKKISLIAYYVYFFYLRDDYSTYTSTGVVQSDAANSSPVSPVQKQMNAWNEFVRMYNPPHFYNRYGYPSYWYPDMGTNWNGTWLSFGGAHLKRNELTLYEFMQNNSDLYDVSHFKPYGPINEMGL